MDVFTLRIGSSWQRCWLILMLSVGALAAIDSAFGQPATSRGITPVSGDGVRRALVIGNDAYSHMPRLANAINDARAMEGVLKELDFEVVLVENATAATLHRSVSDFARSLRSRDVGLFYYSGHGLQIDGENFLIPIDFNAQDEIETRYTSYPANQALESLEQAGAELSILILDACRDNPFARSVGLKGLASMNAGRSMLIAFATRPGMSASDNPRGANGLFTSSLIKNLPVPGKSLDQIFNQVAFEVDEASGGQQTPWVVKSLMGEYYFVPPLSGSDIGDGINELAFWHSAESSEGPEGLRAYLRSYPDGRFAGLAKVQLGEFDEAVEEPICSSASECTRLGYEQGRGSAEDNRQAAIYYEQGCKLGAARACANLGVMFENAQGVYKDNVKAAELYLQGCEGEDPVGCTYLGFLYEDGRGVPKSPVKAFELFRQGCQGGDNEGCTHLGMMYEDGKGVNQDYPQALRAYSRGCQDHALGCQRLGLMYEKGRGIDADTLLAAGFYRLACDRKDAEACTFLGRVHIRGLDGKRDPKLAAKFYRKGCDLGDRRGCEALKNLCSRTRDTSCP